MADETREMDLSGTAILPADFSKEMRTSFLEYSMSVIIARALPDVRDGLKPVHRRILYAMNEVGVTPTKPHKKSAWTVGEVIGKYHPHGDTAVYDAMVRMAQDFSMRLPLVDGHGNFGSVDGDGAAAMRYTEARLDKAAMELLRDLDKNTVDMQPNYDESIQEPSVLPARFPNLLVNGSSGIAVGMATNVPTHNLGEVIDGAIHLLQNPDATTEELMEYIPGPDFPTGGIIMGTEPIREAYETGRGSLTVRSKCSMEQTSTGKSRIIVSEIPYQVNKSKLIEKIADLVKEKKITEISDLRDESDRKGMRIVIELKKDAVPQVVLNQLYKHTQLQTTFGVNDLALVDGVPRTLSLKEMLHHYLVHQQEVITRRTRFDLEKAEARAHILQGYLLALDNIDEVVQIIKESSDTPEARDNLMSRFGFTEIQADSILEMQLRRLTGLERDKIEKEYAELLEKIDYYQRVLKDPKMVDQIIIDELTEIKEKFADKRRTQILNEEPKDLDIEDLIAEEDMVVTITRSGYVKRLPVATYRQQRRGGKGLQGVNLKDNDFVEQLFVASTHDYMLFFSTKGKVYRLKVHELPVGSRHARGTAIVNLLPFQGDEAIAAVISTKDFPKDEYLVFGTKQGMVKKTSMELYDRSRRDGIIAISLKDDDELIAVRRCKPGKKVVMVSSGGKAIKWDEAEARPMGRDTMGVRGMSVSGEDRVIAMEVADESDDMFVVTEYGYGKRTGVGEYPTHHRGGQGVYTIQMTEKKGKLVGMKIVRPGQELMIISEEGVVIRVGAEGISKQGRSTQGVKVMSVSGGDRVCALARVAGGSKKKAAKKSDDGQLDGQAAIVDQAGNLIGSEENAALEQHLANAAAAAAAAEDGEDGADGADDIDDLADELMAEELEGDTEGDEE